MAWRAKKTLVEDSLKLRIRTIHSSLRPGYCGSVYWAIGDRRTNSISYSVIGGQSGQPVAVRLSYTQTGRDGSKNDLDYRVALTSTTTPWGALRWWFICPLRKGGQPCGRRVGALYLPPGARYFGCRHCHDLTYRSCQEQHQADSLYSHIALMMQGDYPGMTPRMAKELLGRTSRRTHTPEFSRYLAGRVQRYLDSRPDRYARYLTAGDLCAQSGLTPGDLADLEAARLLLPDHDGKYRPKLAGWGRKLAYLLQNGWGLNEIATWARGRWSTPNPRQFPPDRALWTYQDKPTD